MISSLESWSQKEVMQWLMVQSGLRRELKGSSSIFTPSNENIKIQYLYFSQQITPYLRDRQTKPNFQSQPSPKTTELIQFELFHQQLQQNKKMKANHHMDIEQCCSNLKETLYSLKSAVGNASPISQPTSLSFKPQNQTTKGTHQRSSSEQMSIEEDINGLISPFRKYKCFKCYGVNSPKNTSYSIPLCEQCDGAEYISDSHPLSALLEKVMVSKLPSLARSGCEVSSFTIIDHGTECEGCHKVIESDEFYACQCCPQFIVCEACYYRKRYDHPHTRFMRKGGHNVLKLKQNLPAMKKISQELESDQGCTLEDHQSLCSNCGDSIEQCYEVCLDCSKHGNNYRICNHCSETRAFEHPSSHKLELCISNDSKMPDLVSRQSNTSSVFQARQSIGEEAERQNKKNELSFRSSSIVNIPQIELECSSELQEDSPTYDREGSMIKFDNSSSDNFLLSENFSYNPESFEESPILAVRKEPEGENRLQKSEDFGLRNESMVKINMEYSEDHSDYFASRDFKLCTSQLQSQDISGKALEDEVMSPTFSKSSENPKEDYLFKDYECDICKITPIRNKRYHCKQCLDTDICEDCYKNRSCEHLHQNYEQIDGKKLEEEKELRLTKVINLQRCSMDSFKNVARKSIRS